MIKFSDLIKSKRSDLNLTLNQIEKETGITASYVNRIEKGQIKGVSAENVFKLAEALNISLNEVAKSFSVNLKDSQSDLAMSSVTNPKDYESIINITKCAIDISNAKIDYDKAITEIVLSLDKLKKRKCTVIGTTENSNFAVEIKNYDKRIIEIVSNRLKEGLGAEIIIVDGELLYYDDVRLYTDLRDFEKDFFMDDDCEYDDYEIEKEEISRYIERYY